MLAVLSDGRFHTREELAECFNDETRDKEDVSYVICNLRKKLEPVGRTITTERRYWKRFHRMVILIAADDG